MAKIYRVGPGTRLVNLVFVAMTRRGLGKDYRHLLTVRGRKTGEPHTTPVDVTPAPRLRADLLDPARQVRFLIKNRTTRCAALLDGAGAVRHAAYGHGLGGSRAGVPGRVGKAEV